MKRLLTLLSLIAVPACIWAADAAAAPSSGCGCMAGMKEGLCAGPVAPRDETWAARTNVGVKWGQVPHHLVKKHRNYDLYSVETVQPLYRSDDLHNTFMGFAGIGTTKWKHASWNVGAGYRHITASADNMFGVGVAYHHMDFSHLRFHGPAAYIGWLSQYTDLVLSRSWNRLHVTEHPAKSFLKHNHRCEMTSLDLAFQVPYLPWAKLMLGRTWFGDKVGRKCFHSYRGASLEKLDYALKLNLLGCLSLEGGYLGGWTKNPYVRLVLSFGRPACHEYCLTDGFLGNEAFTARDLKNYTLAPVVRNRIDTLSNIK